MLLMEITRRHGFCRTSSLALLMSGLIVTGGCTGGLRLMDIPGSISVDGKSPEGATIMFHPTDPKQPLVSTAAVGTDGKFKVVTDMNPGIPVGSYKVTVIWPDPSKQPTAAQRMTGLHDDGPDLLGGKYANRDQSPLTMEVTGDMKELPNISITTQ